MWAIRCWLLAGVCASGIGLAFGGSAFAQGSIAGNNGSGIGGNAISSGGGGTPGGSTGQVQYNNAGSFGGLATTGTGSVVLAATPTLTGVLNMTGNILMQGTASNSAITTSTANGGNGNLFLTMPLSTNLMRISANGSAIVDINGATTSSTNIYNSLHLAGPATAGSNALNMNNTWTGTTGSFSMVVLQAVDSTVTTGAGGSSVLNINQISNSTLAQGVKNALQASFSMTGPSGNSTGIGASYSAAQISASSNNNDNGTATGFGTISGGSGSLFAMNPTVQLGAASTYWAGIVGAEFDITALSGSSVNSKHGLSIVELSGDTAQGAFYDDAIDIGRADTQATGKGWKVGLTFGNPGGHFPMDPTGTIITANTVSGTMLAANGIDFHLVTFSGNFLQSQGFAVNGSGLTTESGGIADSGGINTTFASGYEISGTPVLNLYANQTSPIISPEVTSSPLSTGTYQPLTYVIGHATTLTSATVNTYESMITSNLTLSGTATNHYGMLEQTANMLGTGTFNAELNVQKNYINIVSGATLSGGSEEFEGQTANNGTISGIGSNFTASFVNGTTGTTGTGTGFSAAAQNNNTTGGSFGTWIGYTCYTPTGSGTIGSHQCFYNQDIGGEIINAGHYAARPDSGQPTYSTGCTANARGNDVIGIVTQAASTTTCTVTFKKSYSSSLMCFVTPLNNNPVLTTSYNSTTVTWTNAAVTGAIYAYYCMDGF